MSRVRRLSQDSPQPFNDPFGSTESVGPPSPNRFQFTARENDGTGLYYYRARYYDPVRSRFVSEDPIGLGGGDANLYAYVANAPVNVRDPQGTGPIAVSACVAYMGYDAYSTIQTLKQLQQEIDDINKQIQKALECGDWQKAEDLRRQALEKARARTAALAYGAGKGFAVGIMCGAAAGLPF